MVKIWGGSTPSTSRRRSGASGSSASARADRRRPQFGVINTPAYLRLNPNGLVPTLEDDGFVLWESNAIVRYLAASTAGGLWPTDPRRAPRPTAGWTGRDRLRPGHGPAFRGLVRTHPSSATPTRSTRRKRASEAAMKLLDGHLAGRDFMEAGQLTIGDIAVGVIAYRWFGLGNPREATPDFARYYDRLVGAARLPRACDAAADVRPARVALCRGSHNPSNPALERGQGPSREAVLRRGCLRFLLRGLPRGFRRNERKLGLAPTAAT